MGTVYTASELITMIRKEGWTLDRIVGSHHVFTHKTRLGVVVVPKHTGDLPKGTAMSILKQAGLK
ncbi:MAG: type II toxin-antitoxin system HicA family toxin [Coriobacteriales bacterium]|nr:type II toxin-antitoxin system HicA family toxin [Coriobacteriales bacterium]